MSTLDDGRYDAIVIDARDDADANAIHLELAIASGARKGEVVRVNAPRSLGDELALLGLPATLTVDAGIPHVVIDR